MSVALRETTWRDIETLAALEAELFADDAWSAGSWWSELAARPRRDYVSLVDSVTGLLGYAGLDLGGEVADVMTIAVAPVVRGRGYGAVLIDHLVAVAAASGATCLMLEVRADNAAALGLYGSRGFETVSVRRRYYGDVDAQVMRLALTVAAETIGPTETPDATETTDCTPAPAGHHDESEAMA